MSKIFFQSDTNLELLRSRSVAVIGYGNQGQAHAQNLRDSGCHVVVAQRPGGRNHALAIEHGFQPVSAADAAKQTQVLILSLPDEIMADVYTAEIEPHVRPGQALGFVHGFNIRFGLIQPPPNVDVILVAPKGPGTLVREAFTRGGGLTCLIAVHQDATSRARETALAWGTAIGGGIGGMIETTFAAECEADLFGEQTVLCGGVIELMKSAYDILLEAGFPPEVAYFECVHEVKQIVDMQYTAGLAAMRSRISNTAAYGGLTRGPRLVTDETRAEMRAVLAEIRSGQFAAEWIAECRAGKERLSKLKETEGRHPSESGGERVRELAKKAVPATLK